MKLRVGLIVFCSVFCVGAGDSGAECEDNVKYSMDGMLGFGLELILSKLEIIEHKLQKTDGRLQKIEKEVKEQKSDQKKVAASLNELRSNQNKSLNEICATLQNLDGYFVLNVTGLQNRTHETEAGALQKLDQAVGRVPAIQNNVLPSSCKDVLPSSTASGTYLIRANSSSEPFRVFCEQRSYGGGWIMIQYRYDGSLDFYRGWNEFRDGFGDLKKEFWLGLEKVHQMTKARKHELIVELKDFSGEYKFALYDGFEIGSESEGYVLKNLGSYSGTAGDAMRRSKGRKFSTKDRLNEMSLECFQRHEGAWWQECYPFSNLNGRYVNSPDQKSMFWWRFKDSIDGLSYSRMMIRELE
ncbi:fibrinogen-like protein A [Anopheles aquasalis]|uniref:fibrinogen-like protein A n=1 Tax=Anopheles aquasalis TaxID=42839 RepID=UPI00215A44D3|nr:fibrinogen-like protein A [Anopheles aquasalis]